MAKNFNIPLINNPALPLNGFTPVAWMIEIVRGCNLKCGYCATALFPRNQFDYMTDKVFINAMTIVNQVSPKGRVAFVNAGEGTLHPNLYNLIRIARSIAPKVQLDIITNGTTLLSGKVTYEKMFEAGLNIALVDVYGSPQHYYKIAKMSGYPWYDRVNPPQIKKYPKAWTNNHDVSIKQIIFQTAPEDWPKSKNRNSYLSTMLNDLDWNLAKEHGLEPVIEAPNRRCDQPSKYANICSNGDYIFCCQDLHRHTGGLLGNVSSGVEGFTEFWMGNYMQSTRHLLDKKNRKGHQWCSKCKMCTTRADIPFWPNEALHKYYYEGKWQDIRLSEVEKND